MRVIHAVRQYLPIVGGLENFVQSLSQNQIAQGIEAEVLTLNRVKTDLGAYLPPKEVVNGVPVTRFGFRGSLRYPIAPGVLRHIKHADIVHVHAVDFFCDYLALTRPIHGKPLVLTTHGGFFHTPFAATAKKAFFRTITPLSMRGYDRVIACSQTDYDLFEPVAGKRLQLVENAVDHLKFGDASSPVMKPSFLFIGRFAGNKGIENLIKAFGELAKFAPDARLHIAGSDWGGLLASFRKQLETIPNAQNIHFHMNLDDAQLKALMKDCCFFISASKYEAFGLTTLEAMSAGLIPVLNDIKAFNETVGVTGVGRIVTFDDPRDAAESIFGYMNDVAAAFPAMRARAIEAAAPFNWENNVRRTVQIYRSILSGPGSPAE